MGPTGLKSRCQQGCVSSGGSREECFLDFCRMWKWPTLLGSVSHSPVSKPAVSHLLISLSVSNLSSPSLVHLRHSCIPLINIRTLANALAHRIGGGVQLLSCERFFATPWTAAHQASLSITISWSLLKLMFIESVMPSNHLILCHPLLLLPSIFPSIRVFSNEWVLCISWPKYWSFSLSISPCNEDSGLISLKAHRVIQDNLPHL